MQVFVARQAIFDRAREVCAYELLFRSDNNRNEFDGTESGSATSQVIANSLFGIGLDQILGGKKAFINFDRTNLIGGLRSILPPETMVVEILESVEPDEEVVATCRDLLQLGYQIALDDFVGQPEFEPLTQIATFIKVDIRATTKEEQERLLRTYQPRGVSMVAEKVETHEEFECARRAGFDFFQGYFFARPVVLGGHQIPATKVACLNILREVQATDLDFVRLAKTVSEDVALSYKLLRFVNSAAFYRQTEIHSIEHALVVLGEQGVRQWVALAAVPALAKDKPGELVTHSLVRAYFCERLALLTCLAGRHLAFLMGLFSLLDALLDVPLEEALRQVCADSSICGALLGTDPYGTLSRVYQLACRYELGDWDAVVDLGQHLSIKTPLIGEAYADSILCVQHALHGTTRKTNSRRRVRYAANGTVSIGWEDGAGTERTSTAKLINVSEAGLQLQLTEPIPVHAQVYCNSPKLRISGSGSVRYCLFSRGKYLIGLEFSNGSGWRAPSA